MASISAADVNKLRQMTGVGMMDCKKALVECDGDFEKAIDFLRQKGQKLAAKRAERDANEGVVLAKSNGTFGAVIMVNCETDFVANNADFVAFTQSILDNAIAQKLTAKDAVLEMAIDDRRVADLLTDQIAKIGEKIDLAHYESIEGVAVSAYIHPGNRMASVVALSKEGFQEIGHNLAMQVVAMRPVALDENSVSPEVIEKELEVYRAQIREEGKPENMVENIAKGKLNKFFKENTLLSQESITEAKTSVKDFVAKADKDLKVLGFRRLELGA